MSKLINISDRTYEKLKEMKDKDESFTIVIEKKSKNNKRRFMEFYGRGGIDEEAIAELKKGWKKWTEGYA